MPLTATLKETSFSVGDVVRVHQLLTNKSEDEKGSRTQVFEGTVIGIRGTGMGKNFIVRRIGEAKIGIEQIFPIESPLIDKIEVVRSGKRGVRQAKIYYIRGKSPREIERIYTRAKRIELSKAQKQVVKPKKVVKKTKKVAKKVAPKKSSKK